MAASTAASYTVDFTATHAIAAGGEVTLVGPPGLLWPSQGCNYTLVDITSKAGDLGCPAQAPTVHFAGAGAVYNFEAASGRMVSLTVPNGVAAGARLRLIVDGVTDPGPGLFSLGVSTSSDPALASSGFTITPAIPIVSPSVALSNNGAGDHMVTYTINLRAGSAIPLGGYVLVSGPPGMLWGPSSSCNYSVTDLTRAFPAGGCPTVHMAEDGFYSYGWGGHDGRAFSVAMPGLVAAGDRLKVTVTGATNPGPGTYRLSVYTSSQDVPVLSQPFVVRPASALAGPTVSVAASTVANAPGLAFTVGFRVRHSLRAGSSITLVGPPGTVWPGANWQYGFSDYSNKAQSGNAAGVAVAASGQAVTVTVPSTAPTGSPGSGFGPGDRVSLTVDGVSAPAGSGFSLYVVTSSDPVWSRSSPFSIRVKGDKTPAPSGTRVVAAKLDLVGGAGSDGTAFSLSMALSRAGALAAGQGSITVLGAPGTVFGTCAGQCGPSDIGSDANYDITDQTTASGTGKLTGAGQVVAADGLLTTLPVPQSLKAGDHIVIYGTQLSAPVPGTAPFWVFTSADPVPVAVSSDVAPGGSVRHASLTLSSRAAGANDVTYQASFVPTAELVGGVSSVTIVGPPGTIFSTCPYGCNTADNNDITVSDAQGPKGSPPGGADSVTFDSSAVSFLVSQDIPAGRRVTVTMSPESNPPAGSHIFSIFTSTDPRPVALPLTVLPDSSLSAVKSRFALVAPSQGALPVGAPAGSHLEDLYVDFKTSPDGWLQGGASVLTLMTPGLSLSGAATAVLSDITHPPDSGSTDAVAMAGGTVNNFVLPQSVPAGDSLSLEVPDVIVPPGASLQVNLVSSSDPALAPPSTATSPRVNSISSTITSPRDAFKPTAVVVNAAITVGLVLFITFPAALFNQTFSENYADIVAWWQKWALRLFPSAARRRFSAAAGAFWALVPRRAHHELVSASGAGGVTSEAAPVEGHPRAAFAAVVAVGALLGALLDPHFGANGRTVLGYVGIVLSTLAGIAVSGLVTHGYHRARKHGHVPFTVHALPLGLLVAAVCVLVSRLSGFEPGYLYGVVAGLKFNRDLAKHEEGHLVVIGSLATIGLAVLGWMAWDALNPTASKPGAFFGGVIADNFVSALFVGGLVGTVISLLPLRFLPGHKLQSWHRGWWAATFGVALFLLVDAILRPDSHVARSHTPLVTAVVLFVAFGGGSLLFRQHFAHKHPPKAEGEQDGSADGEGGHVGAGQRPELASSSE